MKTKRISNFSLLSITIVVTCLIIIIASLVKIRNNQNEKLIYAMESKIKYYAKRCYLEEKCSGDITLKDLYEKEYLSDNIVNPVTKEIIDENTLIKFQDNQIILNIDEKKPNNS